MPGHIIGIGIQQDPLGGRHLHGRDVGPQRVIGLGRHSFALFQDDPSAINRLEQQFAYVTPELVRKTAQEYLRPTNRTILTIEPKAQAQPTTGSASGS